jgi:Synaptobrevin
MLRAIAIYDDAPRNASGTFQRISFAQQDKGTLFNSNQLADLEKYTLPSLPDDLDTTKTYSISVMNEYHYVKKNPGDKFIMTICSRSKLAISELHYLFINMRHAHLRSASIGLTLNDIMANPIGYTGHDALLTNTKKEVHAVKDIMIANIDKILINAEKLDELKQQTERLVLDSDRFNKSSKALNRCCGMM